MLAALNPKVNLLFHFSILLYLKHDNLWSPLASLMREIDMCVSRVFYRKFNFQQLSFEVFFDTIGGNFSGIKPLSDLS